MNALSSEFLRLPGISAAVFGERDFQAVRALLHAESGIVLPPGKAMLVYSRWAPLVRNSGSGTFAKYLEYIEKNATERRKAICALTTNHTFFFRENHHFEHFASEARPKLIERAKRGGEALIWSAGCSSGEETWSITTTLLGADRGEGRTIAKSGIKLLASDLAAHALAAAKAATYPTSTLEAMPAALRANWTVDRGGSSQIVPEAHAMVRFRTLNLLGDWPMKKLFDIIFCRNVMIYFDQPTKERLVNRFADQLAPGGFLYIGHSERVVGPAEAKLQPVGNTIYRKVG